MRSPRWYFLAGVIAGLVIGGMVAWAGFGIYARRQRAALAARVTTLEADAAQLNAERERLHRELGEIVQERREMAETAEHLRGQVEQQLKRLETLANELAPPAEHGDAQP
jgi:uncharacterized membrane protein